MNPEIRERVSGARRLSATDAAGTIRSHYPFWDTQYRPVLLEGLRRLPAEHFGFKPQPGMMTARQFLVHIAEAEYGWIENIVNGREYQEWVVPHADPAQGWVETIDVPTHAAIEELLERCHRPTQRWFDADVAELSRVISYRRDSGEMAHVTLHWVLDHVQEHELHHRAQLYVYLRMLGIAPPPV